MRRPEPIRLLFTLAHCSECLVRQRLPEVDCRRPHSVNRTRAAPPVASKGEVVVERHVARDSERPFMA